MYRIVLSFTILSLALTACLNDGTGQEARGNLVRQRISIFLIDPEVTDTTDDDRDCNDELAPISRIIETESGSLQVSISAALHELFSTTADDPDASGLYTAVHGQNLDIANVRIHDRSAVVNLQGYPSFASQCDAMRFSRQIEATIGQFSGIAGFSITLNESLDAYESLSDVRWGG